MEHFINTHIFKAGTTVSPEDYAFPADAAFLWTTFTSLKANKF